MDAWASATDRLRMASGSRIRPSVLKSAQCRFESDWEHWKTSGLPIRRVAGAGIGTDSPAFTGVWSSRRCERADLDGDSPDARDFGHSRMWLNRKNIDSPPEELLGSDSCACPNIERRLREGDR
jgi:hypothetical protein